MKKYSFILVIYVVCVLTWGILIEDLSLRAIGSGFIIATVVLLFSGKFISDSNIPEIEFDYLIKLLKYPFKLLVTIYNNSFKVVHCILLKEPNVNVIKVRLPSNIDIVNAMVCNAITLSPGTISLEKQGDTATVLVLNYENKSLEELTAEIEKNFESLVQK